MNHSAPTGDAQSPPRDGKAGTVAAVHTPPKPSGETGGPKGPEPTRYGDWERAGRCIDF